ncbi:hypothetical protein IAU59_003540 [Kwoniella sp. CBS 9459]
MEGEIMDPAVLAAVLSADFPLVDSGLIAAMVNDHAPETLSSVLPAIKDHLGILEATMVPDPDESTIHSPNPSWTESTSESVNGIDELSNKLESLGSASSSGRNGGRATTAGTSTGAGTSAGASASMGTSLVDDGETGAILSEDEDVGLLDEIELLKALFPAIAEEDLQSALGSSPSLQDTIDHLLSFELIRDVEAQGHWPGEESGTDKETWEETDAKSQTRSRSRTKAKTKSKKKSSPVSQASSRVPSISTTPVIPSSPRLENSVLLSSSSAHSRASTAGSTSSKKKTKKDKTIIPLVDTMQRRATPIQSRSASASASRGRSVSPPRAGPSDNVWSNISSVSSFLADLLPYPATYFLKYLHAPEYHSAYSAVQASLAALPSNATANDGPSRKVLEDMYEVSLSDSKIGKRQIRSDLEVCFHAAGEDVATVMDLMDLLNDISEWPGDDDLFEPRPEFNINKQPKIISAATHQMTTQPVIAIDMARTASNASTASNGSSVLAPTTTTLVQPNGTTSITITNGNALPGKMTKPQSKTKTKKAEPEVVLSGGAIREAKLREVPGSKPSLAINSNLPALNPLEITSPLIPSSPKLKSSRLGSQAQVHPQNWRTVSHARKARPTTGSAPSARPTVRKLTVEECQARAALERARRETAIRAAGSHFKYSTTGLPGGNRTVKATISGHYAAQAKEAADRAREWDLRAARLVVESHLGTSLRSSGSGVGSSTGSTPYTNGGSKARNDVGVRSGGNKTIDLHHMTVNEAITIVAEIIEPWWTAEKEARAERWKAREEGKLVIITGVGRHSVGNKGVLGPAVSGFLDKDGWRIERGDSERGFLVVWGRK